jgi:hypothetical protein
VLVAVRGRLTFRGNRLPADADAVSALLRSIPEEETLYARSKRSNMLRCGRQNGSSALTSRRRTAILCCVPDGNDKELPVVDPVPDN